MKRPGMAFLLLKNTSWIRCLAVRGIKAFSAIVLLTAIFCFPSASAQNMTRAADVGPGFTKLQLGPFIEVLRDPTHRLSIHDVASASLTNRFEPHLENTFRYGPDRAIYWFRFRIHKSGVIEPHTRLILVVTRPFLQDFHLYIPLGDAHTGQFHHMQAASNYYRGNDDLGSRLPALMLPDNISGETYLYLRCRMSIGQYAITLFSETEFGRHRELEMLFFGLTVGIIAAMFLFNLALAIVLKERVYFIYCAFIVSMSLYLALMSGWMLNVNISLDRMFLFHSMWTILPIAIFLGMAFSRIFLATKENHPILDFVFKTIIGFAVASLFLSMVGMLEMADMIIFFVGLIGPVAVIICAVLRWRQGYQSARYYLAAWSVFCLASIIYTAYGLGFFEYSFLMDNVLSIGHSMEAIILSFALGDRIRLLRTEQITLKEQERRLTELSIRDELTGLYNKRWFNSKLLGEIEHARRLSQPLSLIMLDVDHFKNFNDNHGHAAGDRVLKELGRIILNIVRQTDTPCRFGGEEFTVILPGADRDEALTIAERLRHGFANLRFKIRPYQSSGATISLGVAQLTDEDDEDSFFQRSDGALYQAKSQGRNRSVVL